MLNIVTMKKRVTTRFGERVRQRRIELGISQEELAARAGVHRTYIGMIERAEKNVTLESIEKICKALNVSLGDFFKDFE